MRRGELEPGSWRDRARRTIAQVRAGHPELRLDPEAMLAAVDAAYPFGERKYLPYAAWLQERAAFIASLTWIGDPLVRPCPACGAKRTKPCRDIDDLDIVDGDLSTARCVLADAVEGGEARPEVLAGLCEQTVHQARLPPTKSLPLFDRI